MIHQLGAVLLSRLPAETAHRMTIDALKLGLGPVDRGGCDPILAIECAGLSLPNCVGLAAGFDKNAEVPDAMLLAGFGFVECGTVTPRAQSGNPRPRLMRLREDLAVVNRMGFNNEGLDAFASRLERRPRRGVVGANIGANKDSDDRIGDYVIGLTRLWPHADYFTVNISSPNTPGLRDLQGRAALEDLLGRLAEARAGLRASGSARPVFLKVAPDLDDVAVTDIVEVVLANGLDGIVVSNTTITRPETLRSPLRQEAGGLSGAPIFALSTQMLRRFRERAPESLVLIGCGGVASGADAYAKIRAGAQAIQLYSSLVYRGPGLVGEIKRDLAARLRADGFASVTEAAGAG
jgi:dihydroorotate dehydrogenase